MLLTSMLSDEDLYLFNEGTHVRLYEKLGAIPSRTATNPPPNLPFGPLMPSECR